MPRWAMFLGSAALALTVMGCANRQAEQARTAQQTLVGLPAETLLSCAGVPDRRETVDATEFFTYENIDRGRGGGSSISIGGGGGGGNLGLGVGIGIPLGGGGPSGCVATFTVEQGRVTRLSYRPDSQDTAACYAIVENCLQPAR